MTESDPLVTTDPSQPAMDQILQDNIKTPRRWMGLRLAQTAGLVQDALATTEFARQKEREVWEIQKATLGIPSTNGQQSTPAPQPSGDDVGNINVGDTHYHITQPAQAAAMAIEGKTNTVTPTTAESKPSTLGKLGKWAAIAALAASSGAGGAGLAAYFLKPAATAVVQDASKYLNDGEIFQVVPKDGK